ncbi:hypothetical protein ACMBCQ_01800 [Candidatus Phytoplasma citri]
MINYNKTKKITDIEIMMLLTYDQSVTFFKTKYGLVSGSYFMDASFTQTNPNIKKTAEGLEIHHIKEYQARGLSNPNTPNTTLLNTKKALIWCIVIY